MEGAFSGGLTEPASVKVPLIALKLYTMPKRTIALLLKSTFQYHYARRRYNGINSLWGSVFFVAILVRALFPVDHHASPDLVVSDQ